MTAYLRPRDLDEALAARAAHPDWLVLAGGTDLMVNANHRPAPAGILDLWRLAAICLVRRTDEAIGGAIAIGAGTTWLEVERDPHVRAQLAPLAAAAREIGALQIQARATLGGNVGTSSPVGDSLPVLLALDAELELASPRGRRRVAYRDWCTGYRTTQLAADELIVAAHVPIPGPATRTAWRKVGTRRAQSISKVMGAAAITLDGDVVVDARIALGAIADRPVRIAAAEAAVRGLRLTDAAAAARAAVASAIRPIDDIRSTASYRREVAANLVARFFGPAAAGPAMS
jgi:CO/xanthine dehydrogenase FAD-binding subunit